jgi:hypothetical protein
MNKNPAALFGVSTPVSAVKPLGRYARSEGARSGLTI